MASSSWGFFDLGGLAKVQGGFAFKSKDFTSRGVPVVKIKNVRKRDINLSEVAFVSVTIADKCSNFFIRHGDVLISMTGSGPNAPASIVGRVARHSGPNNEFLINQRVGRFVNKDDHRLDLRYLYYFLSQQAVQEQLVSIATGSANQVNISAAQIESIQVPLGSLQEQKAIAHILGTLDDKIELNRQMNATLEAMAQALFKSWFVDFDPVIDNVLAAGHHIPEPLQARAKARKALGELRKPLPEEIQKQFPNRFTFNEDMGWVPEGWNPACIGKVVSQRKEKAKDQQVTVLSAIAEGELVPSDQHFTKQVYSKSTEKYLVVREWDFAYNPSRINIGSVGMLKKSYLGAVSPVYVVASPILEYRWFLDFYIRSKRFHKWVETLASGSVRQSLSFNDFSSIPCVIPEKGIARNFNHIYEEWRTKITANSEQNKSLEVARDTLLPKLLSGQLRIPDAEKKVAEAI